MKKINISIGISVYNEDANIGLLLKSILKQKEISFKIYEILIFSDGSDDRTVDIINSFKDKRIKVVDSSKRLGKPRRMNTIFREFKGECLFITDGDVVLDDLFVIEKLVKKAKDNPKLSLIMANIKPLPGKTTLERGIYNFFSARESVTADYDYRKTVYAARAAGMLLTKKFAESIILPTNILNDDAYIYLLARSKKLEITFVSDALIWFRSASKLQDFKRQFKRYLEGEEQMNKYFKNELLVNEYKAPKKALLKIMLKQIKLDPYAYFTIRAINSFCKITLKFSDKQTRARWTKAVSSKTLFINEMMQDGRMTG